MISKNSNSPADESALSLDTDAPTGDAAFRNNPKMKGFIPLIPKVYMRRLKNRDGDTYVEIRFEDMDVFDTLRQAMGVLLSGDFLEEMARPVAEKVMVQVNDEKRRVDGGHHLMLELDESVIFFNLLIEVDRLDREYGNLVSQGGAGGTPAAEQN